MTCPIDLPVRPGRDAFLAACALQLLVACTGIDGTQAAAQAAAQNARTPANTANAANTLTVGNPGFSAVRNYPLQIGRPFRPGEIAAGACPVLDMAGTPIATQADVKNRWPDGSVRFAVLSAILPEVGGSASVPLAIRAGACTAPAAMTPERLLATDFEVELAIDGGAGGRVSARAMLAAGASITWTGGPVTTTMILADHATKAFDVGAGPSRPLRPIIHVQYWPAIDAYKVRVVVEQSDTTKLRDQAYAVQVSAGRAAPVAVYRNPRVAQHYGSRWTREFWVGAGKPARPLHLRHDVAYLASTHAIPNYDSRITLSGGARAEMLSAWDAAPKDLYGAGLWTKYMPTSGGRAEIGLFPSWHIAALYSGDAALWQMAAAQSDLAAAWPMHFRIGDARVFDRQAGVPGLGRIATRDAFPTQFLYAENSYLNRSQVAAEDRFIPAGPSAIDGWVPDGAHQPDPWYLMYLTSGDPWYLEQLQFWASWGLFNTDPGADTWASGRDARDTVIQEQLRGVAWVLRTRARAAAASVDGTPEQAYLRRSVEQALRMMEGVHIGPGADPIRSWWAANGAMKNNPLRFWTNGDPALREGMDSPAIASGDSPWMHSMLIQALGHTAELGFGATELLRWIGPSWITLVNGPGTDPRHLADYRMPVRRTAGGYFQTWPEAFASQSGWNSSWEENLRDTDHGYSVFAIAALSFLAGEPGGDAAWDWAYRRGYTQVDWRENPKMAIVPR